MVKRLTTSVIIPVYNESAYIEAVLKALEKQSLLPDEIIVVDNNSTDDTVKKASRFNGVKIVSEKKQGNVFARNRGFEEATQDIICKLDADSLPDRVWLEEYLKLFTDDIAAASGYFRFYDGSLRKITAFFSNLFVFYANKVGVRGRALFGSNYMIRREVWGNIQKDTHARSDIWEDMDLSIALQRNRMAVAISKKTRMGISVRTSTAGFWHTLQLYAEWQRTFFVNKRYIATFLVAGIVIVLFPVSFFFKRLVQIGFNQLRPDYHH